MEPDYNFWVYIITNRTHTVLYIGMTNDLARRTGEHREGIGAGFPTAFRCKKLIYYEHYRHVQDAIAREKQLKNWSRAKKDCFDSNAESQLERSWRRCPPRAVTARDSSTSLGMTKVGVRNDKGGARNDKRGRSE